MKNIVSIVTSHKLVFILYVAAGLGFIGSIARDFVVINYSSFSADYFQIFYIASVISSIPINALQLNLSKKTGLYMIWILVITSSIFIYISSASWIEIKQEMLIKVAALILIWISGTFISRKLFLRNKILLAKSREAIASFLTCSIVFAKYSLITAIILGPIVSNVVIFVALIRTKPIHPFDNYNEEKKTKTQVLGRSLIQIVLVNLSPIAITLWAIYMNEQTLSFLNMTYLVLARIGLYIFQFISIVTPALAMKKSSLKIKHMDKRILIICLCCLTLPAIFYVHALPLSFIYLPVTLGFIHLNLVAYSKRFV